MLCSGCCRFRWASTWRFTCTATWCRQRCERSLFSWISDAVFVHMSQHVRHALATSSITAGDARCDHGANGAGLVIRCWPSVNMRPIQRLIEHVCLHQGKCNKEIRPYWAELELMPGGKYLNHFSSQSQCADWGQPLMVWKSNNTHPYGFCFLASSDIRPRSSFVLSNLSHESDCFFRVHTANIM